MPSQEFQAVLEMLRANPPAIPGDVAGARAAIDEMMGSAPLADGVSIEPVRVGSRDGEWVRPSTSAAGSGVVLYLHGGAFRIGSLKAYRPFASQLGVALGRPLLVVDYRLAPEDPFPAGLDDCVAAYQWLLDSGVEPADIAVIGDSAGGGLVVSTLLALKARGLPQPGAGVCLSPFADLTRSADSYRRNAVTDPYFNLGSANEAVVDYLGSGDPRDALASPVFADLSGLAPLLIHASTDEVLADDAVALAAKVVVGRGRVQLDLYPEMTHVWHALIPHVPEASDAVEAIRRFLDGFG